MTTPSDNAGATDAEFAVYSEGICFASVCTSLPQEQVEAHMNAVSPSGTMNGWRIAKENFMGGAANPSPCHDHPETHKHYLMEC